MPRRLTFGLTALVLLVGLPLRAAPVIVETPALTPEEQKAQFHLPEGFEIQLVASEPDIGQPMNLQFDIRGRLWVSHSAEYPHPARGEGVQPRDLGEDEIRDHDPEDHVSILEGIGPDGKAAKITHFVNGLNIPIGQMPLFTTPDGTAGVIYGIPKIWFYRDENGDAVQDASKVYFTGFGNVDTHGMISSFTRGFDGWIYACHGFRNTSKIPLPQGGELILNSGNTVRFKTDGSALEQFTWGQVNPFGMSLDPWGNLYNADCHSYPITLLLRGAYYESFGKPHDGLGFGPVMIDHNHGSTGICGVAYYDDDRYAADFRDCLYICNPVNGQVHRDKLVWTGSSPKADSQPEFVTCDDGWFRPVDVKLGPDGALYIADFYNSIIGHYEAPLKHPKRGKGHGRIWRVVYQGTGGDAPKPAEIPNLAGSGPQELVDLMAHPNFAIRLLATNLLVDRVQPPTENDKAVYAADEVTRRLRAVLASTAGQDDPKSARQRVHAAWALDRLTRNESGATLKWLDELSHDPAAVVRNHVARILGEHPRDQAGLGAILLPLLKDPEGRVKRAAAEALALHPRADQIGPLLDALESTNPKDEQLVHAIRLAVREHLRSVDDSAASFAARGLKTEETLANIAVAVHPSPKALTAWLRDFVVRTAGNPDVPRSEWRDWLKQASRYSDGGELAGLIAAARTASKDDIGEHIVSVRALTQGRQAGGQPLPPELTTWGEWLAMNLLADESRRGNAWTYQPTSGRAVEDSPFAIQERISQDGGADAFFCTLPKGEQRTGVFRSPGFTIPATLSFWVAGHDGTPDQPLSRNNFVRLLDAETGKVLHETSPPRNDTAQLVTWNCDALAGKTGVVEIVDGDDRGAYAWLAVGRFNSPELNPAPNSPGETAVALIRELQLKGLLPRLKSLSMTPDSGAARQRAAQALVILEPDARSAAVLPSATDSFQSPEVRERVYAAIVSRDGAELDAVLKEILNRATTESHKKTAELLASDAAGAGVLLALIREGRMSPRLLQHLPLVVRLKALKIPGMDAQIEELTSSLPPADELAAKLIADRRASFHPENASSDRGRAVFTKRCATCHQIGTEGQKIGPQLDGIGVRGLDRLLEDILDPNRNVDAAFRSMTIALEDGRIVTGLKRREEGTDLILADQEGKEFRVPLAEIAESKLSAVSLMPANFGEQVPQEEFADLLAWLLSQKAAK